MTGVSANVLLSFCMNHNISMHAIDIMNNKICEHIVPDNKRLGVLAFRIQNNHIYPFDDKKSIDSISKKRTY